MENRPDDNMAQQKELFERISKYREKERAYNEEKIRLDNLLQTLNEELKLSQKKDEDNYSASLEELKSKKQKKGNNEEVLEILKEIKGNEKIVENNLKSAAETEITKEPNEETINAEKKPEKNEVLPDAKKIIEEIPAVEKKAIKAEMKKGVLMDFESPKVKTDYKNFIKNNIVKLVSGFKIPPKLKNIIERNAKKIIMTTAVFTIWIGGDFFVKPDGVKGDISLLKKKEIVDTINKNKTLEVADIETYNKLSENGKRIYLYASSKIEGSYVIIDKPDATLSIIGADKKLIGQMPVLLGQTKGETPNMADPYSDVAVQATTPAGKYTMGKFGIIKEDFIAYKGKVFSIYGSGALALHITYPPEKEKRTEALNTSTPDDNRLSWGCINISEEMWAKYIEGNIKDRGTCLFITPDNPITSLNPETGQVEKGNYNFLAMNNINN